MKPPIVFGIIGTLLKIFGLMLLVPGFVSVYYHETDGVLAFALTSMLSIGSGILLKHMGEEGEVGYKEAFAAVSIGWLAATFFGALPFTLQGLSFIDGLFESVSGLSATGATILTEADPQGYYIVNSTLARDSICAILLNDLSRGLHAWGEKPPVARVEKAVQAAS